MGGDDADSLAAVLGPEGAEPGELAALREPNGPVEATVRGSTASLELSATRLEPAATLETLDAAAGGARVTGRLEGPRQRRLDSPGYLVRWQRPPCDGAGVLRLLAASLEDGSLLLTASRGGEGSPHGEEEVSAALIEAEGAGVREFGESLLSTQYDATGAPVRAGVELWGADPDAPPMRGAATRIAGATLGADGGSVEVAFVRWSVDGRSGAGTYAIWRR
jgi:hypothetical protein